MMTEEEYKQAVLRVGRAFKELPDDRARIDVLASLTGILVRWSEEKGRDGLLIEWLMQAEGALKGCVMTCPPGD